MNHISLIVSILFNHFGKDSAYLDPGSGSILIQLIIAGLVGVGFLLRSSWSKITRFFRGESDQTPEDGDDDSDDA